MEAYEALTAYYTKLFMYGEERMGLQPGIVRTPEEGRVMTGFFTWLDWAAATLRPDKDILPAVRTSRERFAEQNVDGRVKSRKLRAGFIFLAAVIFSVGYTPQNGPKATFYESIKVRYDHNYFFIFLSGLISNPLSEGLQTVKRSDHKRMNPMHTSQSYPDNSPKPSVVRFLLTYLLLMGFFLLIIAYEPIKQVLDLNGLYTKAVVRLSAMMLTPFQIVENVTDTTITIAGIQMQVLFGCSGLEAFMIYSVGIVAFPSLPSRKLWGIVAGFFILQIINVLRIVSLGLVGAYAPGFFSTFHTYIAQGMMIAVALMLFMFWLNWANRP